MNKDLWSSENVQNEILKVIKLLNEGWGDQQICEHLGMELDEVIRLKQVSGLKEAFSNHVFSKSWEEFERNLNSEEVSE